jgi:hypothetical protein
MTSRTAFLTFSAACSLLLSGNAYATGPAPAAQAGHPAPQHAAPAPAPARKPVAVAPRPAAAAPVAATAPQPAEAPRTVSVSGTILAPNGQPCPGVSVFPTFNPRLIAVTDAKGTFSLQLPAPAGVFQLQADYFGVGSSRVTVDSQHLQAINMVLGK